MMPSRSTILHGLTIALVAWTVAAPAAGASAPIRLADQIPADSLLYLEVPSFPAFEKVAREGFVARILAHPEIRQAFGALLGQVEASGDAYLAMGLAQVGIALEDVQRLLAGGLAIGVAGLEVNAGGPPLPHLYVSIDAKGTDAEVWATVERLLGAIAQHGEGTLELGAEQDGIRAVTGDGPPIFASRIGGSLVLSFLPQDLSTMRERVAAGSKVEASLAAAPAFQRVEKSIGRPSLVLAYANVAGILGLVSQFAQDPDAQEMLGIAQLAGVPSIGSAALGVAWGKGEGIATAYLDFPNGRTGIFAIPGDEKLDPAILARVPANAFYACAGGWDLAGSYERLLALVEPVPPAKALIDQKLPALEETLGFKIKDALASIGKQQASWYAFPPAGGFLPEGVAAMTLEDPEGFRAAIEAMCGRMGGEVREIQAAGRTLTIAELPILRTLSTLGKTFDENAPSVEEMLEDFDGPEVAHAVVANMTTQSTMCLDGNTLLVADCPYALRNYLTNRAAAGAKALPSDAFFAKTAAGRLDGQSGFVYLRFDPLLRGVYNTAVPIAQMIAGGALRHMAGVNLAALPTADFLEKELTGALLTYRVDPNAMEIKINTSAAALAVGGVSILAGATVPTFVSARGRAGQVQCMNNLRQLAFAAIMYANDDGKGTIPGGAEGLERIIEKGMISRQALVCHASGRGPDDIESAPCYLWTRKDVKLAGGDVVPLACDAMPWHDGKRNVAFSDGHAELVDEGEFIARYAKYFQE
ncbi:MAG: hypothetical protein JXP34_21240 [Planctomycetes bacterium]|nr:hypothetical protein [Planctomycetota bacterium]